MGSNEIFPWKQLGLLFALDHPNMTQTIKIQLIPITSVTN